MLLNNGYPRRFIGYQIRKFMNKKHLTQSSCNSFHSQSIPQLHELPRIFFKLPYIGEPSIHIEKELKHFFWKKLQDKVQLFIIHVTNKLGQFFNHKQKQSLLLRSNVVYRLKCSCGSCYIGQTRRNIKSRMEEHNPEAKFSYKTDVTKHLLDNPEHTIDFEHPEILASASNLKELMIKETILIQQHRPDINVDDSSLPLYVFNN